MWKVYRHDEQYLPFLPFNQDIWKKRRNVCHVGSLVIVSAGGLFIRQQYGGYEVHGHNMIVECILETLSLLGQDYCISRSWFIFWSSR